MRRRAFDILAIGGIMRDLLCVLKAGTPGISLDRKSRRLSLALDIKHAVKALHSSLGGKAANAAVACARLGLDVGLVGAVGRDDIGDELVRELKKERVDTSLLTQVSLERTGISIILLDESSGEQTSLAVPGANRLLEITEDVQKTFHTTQWVYLASLGDARDDNQRFLVEAIAKEEARLAFVPGRGEIHAGAKNLAPLLEQTGALVMTEEEATEFLSDARSSLTSEQLAAELLTLGPEVVVLTRGARDATISTAKETITVPPATGNPVDTIGAGDAFAATFIAGLAICHGDLLRASQYAATNAASVVGSHTAQKGLLTRSIIEERLRRADVKIQREHRGGVASSGTS